MMTDFRNKTRSYDNILILYRNQNESNQNHSHRVIYCVCMNHVKHSNAFHMAKNSETKMNYIRNTNRQRFGEYSLCVCYIHSLRISFIYQRINSKLSRLLPYNVGLQFYGVCKFNYIVMHVCVVCEKRGKHKISQVQFIL